MSTSLGRVSGFVEWSHRLSRALLTVAAALLPTVAFAQNGTVTGTVTNSATAAPVANASVSICTDFGGGGSNCYSTSTNASGVYTRSVPAGTYYAYTSNSGLVNEIFDNVQCPGSACSAALAFSLGAPIPVAAGATVSGRNFALDPGGSIAGTVTDAATGVPIANVSVSIYTRVGTSVSFISTRNTDASGVYTVAGFPTGTYYALTTNNVGYTNEIYDNVLCPGSCSATIAGQSGTPIPVTNGQTTADRNFTLDVGGRMTGTVVNASTSAPVSSVVVVAYTRIGDSLSFAANATTNGSGVFTIVGLPAATYYVASQVSSTSGLINEIFDNIPCVGFCSFSLPNPGSPLQVGLGATVSNIDFQLDPGGSISGTITDATSALPLLGVSALVYRQVGTSVSTFANASTNASGQYTISGLPTGNYFVVTSSQTHIDEAYNDIVCGGSCSSSTILSSTPVSVVAGSVTSGIDFGLAVGGVITGTVTNANTSAPIAGLPITVYTRVGNTSVFAGSVFSDSTGAWSVQGLSSDTYFAFSDASFGTTRWRNEIYNDIPCPSSCSVATATTSGTPIAVTAGATTAGIDFGLLPSTSPPFAPTGFGAVVNNFVAEFSWQQASSGGIATSFVIEAGVASGQTLVTFNSTTPSLTIPGVPPGRFYLRVRGVNAFGTGPASSEYVMVVNADGSGVLGAPTSFAARMNGGRLTVTWADSTTGGVPTGYLLEVGTGAGLSNIVSVPVASRNFTFEPVPNGVYFLRVRSRNGAQTSPASTEVMIVVGSVPSPPEAPRSLTHTLSGGILTLNWLLPFSGTPTAYVIEAGTANGLSDIGAFPTGSTALTASFTGVPSGTYYVRVRALNAQGRSVASNERTVIVQ